MSESRFSPATLLSRDGSVGAFAAAAMVTWVLVETALRRGAVPMLADPLGSARGADMLVVAVGFSLLAWGIARWGRRAGIDPADWEYEVSLRAVGTGIAGAVAYFVGLMGFAAVYSALVGAPPDSGGVGAVAGAAGPLWAVGALLVVNGVLVPITEELAWRGVIQTALMDGYGVLVGSGVTAAAFVLKHVVVDGGAAGFRLPSLVILALVLCGLRARFGTTSSTVAHLAANGVATATVVLMA